MGTVVVSFIIAAIGWFLLISPTLATASDSRAQAADQLQRNQLLQQQVAKLAEQFKHLDEYKGNLAALQVQLPTTSDLPGLTRQVQAAATQSGVTMTTLNPTVPEAFVSGAAAPVATGATSASAGVAGSSATAPATATPSAPRLSGFYAVPLSITTVGTYDQTLAFLRAVQSGDQRLILVSGLSATSQKPGGAGNGRPATALGDLEVTVTGFAYVLNSAATAPATGGTPASGTGPTLPAPSGQPNPFKSVTGQ
jgi:Tfp pilus assembly protein PilO